jgi:DMSO reductase anchor subunit
VRSASKGIEQRTSPTVPAAIAALASLAGAFVERWLFFAQARHLVTLYY